MKRMLVVSVAVLMIGLMVAALTGCGSEDPEELFKESKRAMDNLKTAHYVVRSSLRFPKAPMTQGKIEKQVYTFVSAGDLDMRTGDLQGDTELYAGVQLKQLKIGEKEFWGIGGYWYEVPQSVKASSSPPVSETLSMSQYAKSFKEITMEPDTTIDGVSCYHIHAIPDMKEFVKQPGITDILKDPTGKQIYTVDEIQDMSITLDFYIMKDTYYIKRSVQSVLMKPSEEMVKLGYATPADKLKMSTQVTFSKYNQKLDIKVPEQYQPLNTAPQPAG